LVARDSRPRIANANVDGPLPWLPSERDLAAFRGELDRVREEIEQHLTHAVAIGPAADRSLAVALRVPDVLRRHERLDQRLHGGALLLDRDVFQPQLDVSRLDPP